MAESDRELLELAAKAYGIDGEYGVAFDDFYYQGNTQGLITELPDGQSYVWNPLTDDGDCARLEAVCQINLYWGTDFIHAGIRNVNVFEQYALHNNDRHAARRRASTKVAAIIGKNIEVYLKCL